jgi:hypothetical protein
MDKHLDALGSLLAAIVFSVGFLSARIHANLDSIVRTVSERSRGIRQEIAEGRRLAPADLAELLSVIHRSTDYIARGSRVLNWVIFATTCAVLGDAIGLSLDGAKAPDNEFVLICLLFAAGLAVVTFSEFDLRRVSIERRREITASTLGRIQNLGYAITAVDVGRAGRELAGLRATFPTWGLLIELEAYVDLLDNRPEQGLRRIESLIETDRGLYVSPVVGTACYLQLKERNSALALVSRIERRDESVGDVQRIHRALAITAGHLPALLATGPSRSSYSRGDPERDAAFGAIGRGVSHPRQAADDLSVALDPIAVSQTAPLMHTMHLWDHGGTLSDFDEDGILARLLRCVVSWETQSALSETQSVAQVLEPRTSDSPDAEMLESVGLVAYTCGEPRLALRFFESAIRLAPAAARSHWGRAIACHRVGWRDAATTSLRRAATLSDETPLLALTRIRFSTPPTRLDPSKVAGLYTTLDDMDRFELALLGVDLAADEETSLRTLRSTFTHALIQLALAQSMLEEAA